MSEETEWVAVEGEEEAAPKGNKYTLEDARANVQALVNLPLDPDQSSRIDAPEIHIHYEADVSTGFVDRNAFSMCVDKYVREASHQAELVALLEEGEQYTALLYTWRGCSQAILTIHSADDNKKREVYQRTIDILEPEIEKLRTFMEYQTRATGTFVLEVKRLCQDRSEFVSETYLHTLGKLINMFAALDELKNNKANIKNDYATYKRASEILKRFTDQSTLEQSQKLSMFLANHNVILTNLKLSLQAINGYEELMCDVINTCVSLYENKLYLLPKEKHGIVKVVGFSLHLIDSNDKGNINKLDAKKKVNLHKIDKMFKQLEVVPLYGDMMIAPFNYIKQTPNFDPEKWPRCTSEKDNTQGEIVKFISEFREQHLQLVSELSLRCTNKTFTDKHFKKAPDGGRDTNQNVVDGDSGDLYDLAQRLLLRLSAWTAKLTEMFSWKLLHPVDPQWDRDKNCPKDAEVYERATRYNYTPKEKNAMTEVLAMIKGIQELALQLSGEFSTNIKGHIYRELQEFVQVQLREPIRKATKHKKDAIRGILISSWSVCSDFDEKYDASKDPTKQKTGKKKEGDAPFEIPIPKKDVPPSTTQLYMLRTMMESLVDKGDKNRTKKTMRKDIESQQIASMEAFLLSSFFWPYMMNFESTLRHCCDLSQFWYREFFLEVTKERIQFPIEMSMPWILTNHILDTEDPGMMQYLLYPLDLYNDSANYALKHFKKQFLYDEIEAEVNLCFDQFVFKLSEQIFRNYKRLAASIMLDKGFKGVCKQNKHRIPYPKKIKYESLLRQTHVQILGRSVDLKKLLTQRINESFIKALQYTIRWFESGDLTGIMGLEGLIQCNKLTHKLLSEFLSLDDFDTMFREANKSVTAPYGRITLYIFLEINYDFMPNFCYNAATNRFVRTVLSFSEDVDRDRPPQLSHVYLWGSKNLATCYNGIYGLYSNFIGPPHIGAMIRLLGYQDVAIIVKEMLEVMKNTITGTVLPYLRELNRVMPQRLKLPRYEYTSAGVFEYFQAQLTDIMRYSDLQPKVYQSLREFGNAAIFSLLLEQSLSQREVTELAQASMFQGIIPRPHVAKGKKTKEEREGEMKKEMTKLQDRYKNYNLAKVVESLGNELQKAYCKENVLLTREKLCCGLSMFVMVLERIKPFLEDELFRGSHTGLDMIWNVTENNEFHRMWSALQFIYCIPPRSKNEHTVEELFGEGLQWAGCLLIMLLNQWSRFETMDFCYHLLLVHKVDQLDKDCRGVSLRKMIDRIRKFQILNNQIFATLAKYMNAGKEGAEVELYSIDHYVPPQPSGPRPSEASSEFSDDVQMRRASESSMTPYDERNQNVFSMFSDYDEYDDDREMPEIPEPEDRRKSKVDDTTVQSTEA